jgi:hypothetical protein
MHGFAGLFIYQVHHGSVPVCRQEASAAMKRGTSTWCLYHKIIFLSVMQCKRSVSFYHYAWCCNEFCAAAAFCMLKSWKLLYSFHLPRCNCSDSSNFIWRSHFQLWLLVCFVFYIILAEKFGRYTPVKLKMSLNCRLNLIKLFVTVSSVLSLFCVVFKCDTQVHAFFCILAEFTSLYVVLIYKKLWPSCSCQHFPSR